MTDCWKAEPKERDIFQWEEVLGPFLRILSVVEGYFLKLSSNQDDDEHKSMKTHRQIMVAEYSNILRIKSQSFMKQLLMTLYI